MKTGKTLHMNIFGKCFVVLAAWLLQTGQSAGATEEILDQLQVGTHSYTNVTVTTKSKEYIFILHSSGMTSIRVSELPSETREKLGYADLTPKPRTNSPAVWAKHTLSRLETPQLKGVEEKLSNAWHEQLKSSVSKLPPLTIRSIALCTAGLLALYFFFCYCCMLICQKAGNNPSFLIFIPALQAFPLLRAAQMSGWWCLAYLMPGINLVAQIIWSIKIVQARRKSGWVAFWLLLPITSVPAFLYLAFSNGVVEPKRTARPVQIMTLETA
jgi:hypothetical protein